MSDPRHTTSAAKRAESGFDFARAASLLTDAAARAGAAIMTHYRKDTAVELKGDSSPVTKADRDSETIIVSALRAFSPEIPIVSEETAGDCNAPQGTFFFLVDPLDGTKEFIKKRTDFTVNIALVENGQRLSAVDVAKGLFQRQELWARVHQFFQRYDLLITPTVAIPPFAAGAPAPTEVAGQPLSRRGWTAFTYPFNLTGNPAITVPCGWTGAGLPIGLQFVGRRLDDSLVLRAAAAFEGMAPWAHKRPVAG